MITGSLNYLHIGYSCKITVLYSPSHLWNVRELKGATHIPHRFSDSHKLHKSAQFTYDPTRTQSQQLIDYDMCVLIVLHWAGCLHEEDITIPSSSSSSTHVAVWGVWGGGGAAIPDLLQWQFTSDLVLNLSGCSTLCSCL